MKLKVFATGLTLTAATLLGTAAVQADEYVFAGDVDARAICQAIVEDDPAQVKSKIRRAIRHARSDRMNQVNEDSFLCNGHSLAAFADQTGARKALAYLEGATVSEAVASAK